MERHYQEILLRTPYVWLMMLHHVSQVLYGYLYRKVSLVEATKVFLEWVKTMIIDHIYMQGSFMLMV